MRHSDLQVNDGKTEEATHLLCNGLQDGSIARQAGFPGASFSYFDISGSKAATGNGHAHDATFEPGTHGRALREGNSGASCMGAPCYNTTWGGECTSTCLCPRFSGASERPTKEGCIHNGEAKDAFTDLDSTLAYIEGLHYRHPKAEMYAEVGSAQCLETCSVE